MTLVAIHVAKGYELFQENGHPFVVREWTSYRQDERGMRVREVNRMRLELVPDHFTGSAQTRDVFRELDEAWRVWREWDQANRKG
jgi:hypothetical protein